MVKVRDIFDYIDSFAPFASQCEWDNSGLLVGDKEKEVKKICFCLDITAETVRKAKAEGADLIVAHHPVIFKPLSHLSSDDPVYLLASYGVATICTHTPWDMAEGGINDILCDILGFGNAKPLGQSGDENIIRVCDVAPVSTDTLCTLVKEKLECGVIATDGGKDIRRVAVCGGAGGDFLGAVTSAGCDAYITGEAKYHTYLTAKDCGVSLIIAGHFETESVSIPVLAKKIADRFPEVKTQIITQSAPAKFY